MHYVYLIQHDLSGEIYIGLTDNPKERLRTHNNKGKKFTTRKSGMWHFIYLELFRAKQDAMDREKKLKGHAKGKHELLKRLKNSLFELKIGEGRSESISGNCLPKTQLPANSQEDV
jgi:predicted GIY-YIG superfamily endonuclease